MKSQLHKPFRRLACAAIVLSFALTAGCGSLGPKTLDKDQLDYGHSIGNSWKNQMLANIVKMRFVDMPVFVDVSSIVSGYTLETQVTGRLGFGDSLTGGDTQGLDASGTYTDRPTISYTPKTGDDYLRSLLHPVEPTNLLALLQAGYSAQLLFTWSVEAVNGLHNYTESVSGSQQADPQFYEYIKLLQDLQNAGAIGFEINKKAESGENIILVMHKEGLSDAIQAKRRRAAELLGLDPTRNRFTVIYAPFSPDNRTLAMQTRSIHSNLRAMGMATARKPMVMATKTSCFGLIASANISGGRGNGVT